MAGPPWSRRARSSVSSSHSQPGPSDVRRSVPIWGISATERPRFSQTPRSTRRRARASSSGKAQLRFAAATRETDVTGWYKDDCVVGVLFTEVALEEGTSVVATVMDRVSDALRLRLSSRQFNQVSISFHLFPEEGEERIAALSNNPPAYPEVAVDVAVNDVVGRLV